jgi:DNA-binding TFAR19-related protein (PDSD5 family)
MASEEDELRLLRAKRMEEMRREGGGGGGGGGGGSREAQVEQQREAIMRQVLQPEAKARLSRIALVKPDRARLVPREKRGEREGRVKKEQVKGDNGREIMFSFFH